MSSSPSVPLVILPPTELPLPPCRIQYDAYRVDLEELNLGPRDPTTLPKLEQAQRDFQVQRERYQKIRDDLTVKLKLLEENKVRATRGGERERLLVSNQLFEFSIH